jgi:hypothetical protein
MYCSGCGAQLSDDVQFCSHCGKSLAHGESAHAEFKYEFCEIVYERKKIFFWTFWSSACKIAFWANAVGKNGRYSAGSSADVPLSGYMGGNPPTGYKKKDQAKSRDAHSQLVNQLLQDGWEPLPLVGKSWWNLGFRRVMPN